MRTLTPNQLGDPSRGSFLVRPEKVAGKPGVIIAPTGRGGETYSNSIEIKPIQERGK